eukprot:COSAG06_NODE_17591_length_932_cov_0.858343_1_plen_139_part_00
MPGGGDWGLQSPQYPESGAVYLTGTKNITFDRCVFKYLDGAEKTPVWRYLMLKRSIYQERLGTNKRKVEGKEAFSAGNAVFIAGYNRNVTITNSELTQIGDSPIALWGYTRGQDPLQPAGTGIDGTGVEKSLFCTIVC